MFILFLISIVLLVGVFFFQRRISNSWGEVFISPLVYFSILWFFAYPFNGILLDWGLIDTQTHMIFSRESLLYTMFLSCLSLLVVVCGVFSYSAQLYRPVSVSSVNTKGIVRPIIVVILLLVMMLAINIPFVLSVCGTLVCFVRQYHQPGKGEGIIHISSNLLVYAQIGLIPLFFIEGKKFNKNLIALSLIFILSSLCLGYIGMVMGTRRLLVLPIFAFTIAIFYIWPNSLKKRIYTLMCALIFPFSIIMSPTLNSIRYLFRVAEPVLEVDIGEIDEKEGMIDEKEGMREKKLENKIPQYCHNINGQVLPIQRVIITDSKSGNERKLGSTASSFASNLCTNEGYSLFNFISTVSSSYGESWSLAAWLEKASFSEILFGVDFGRHWFELLHGMVPRVLWKNKPLYDGNASIQWFLFPHTYTGEGFGSTVALPPGYIVSYLHGFGLLSLLFFSFLTGRFLGWMHGILRLGISSNNTLHFILSLCIMAFLFDFVRNGVAIITIVIKVFLVMFLMFGFRPTFSSFVQALSDIFPYQINRLKHK
jgi:hypothetical protein